MGLTELNLTDVAVVVQAKVKVAVLESVEA